MPIRTPDGYLDITNATLRGSEIITTSNVGIANSAPTHTLSVGNKLFVDDSAANVLTVTGNLVATSLKIGQIDLAPSYGLEHVANVINTVSNVVQFTNTGTGFVSVSNVGIGTSTSPAGLLDVVGAFRMRYQDMGVTKAHIITGANSVSISESGGTYTYTRGGSGNTGNFLPNPSNIVPNVGQRYRVKLTARSDYAGTIRYECPTSTIITTYDLTTSFKEYTWDFTATGTTMQFAVTTVSGTTSQFNAFSIERLGVGFNVNPTSTAAPVQISGVTHFSDNVGIGTASPESALDISSTSGLMLRNTSNKTGVDDRIGYIEFYNGETGGGNRMSSAIEACVNAGGLNNNSDLRFKTTLDYNNPLIERMRIDRRGNVGIGTNNPIAKLDIDGGAENNTTPALAIRGGLFDPSDLYVLNSYSVTSGVGYAAKVIGVNIKNKVETDNTVQIRNNVGGLISAGAIYFGSDNVNQGIFGVLGGTGNVGTTLAEYLTVRDDGNVGIGTASPLEKLDVYGTSRISSAYPRLDFFCTTGRSTNAWGNSTGAAGDYRIYSNGDASDGTKRSLNFDYGQNTTHATRMCINADGNVGIGTASPDLELHVHDANNSTSGIILSSTSGYHRFYEASGQLYFQSGTAASADSRADINFTSMYASTTYMKILGSNGNVGIGLTSPAFPLDVDGVSRSRGVCVNSGFGNNTARPALTTGSTHPSYEIRSIGGNGNVGSAGGDDGFLRLRAGGGTGTNSASYIDLSGYSTYSGGDMKRNIVFGTFGTERMRIKENGNVGIGETSPSYKLDVNGEVRTGNVLYIGKNTNDETAKTILFGGTYGDNGYDHCVIERRVWSTGTEKQELLLFSGNDGENNSGPDRIRLKGAQILFDTLNSSTDRTTENTKMIIRANGNVGIGTTSPGAKLDVNGDINSDGLLKIYGLNTRRLLIGYQRYESTTRAMYPHSTSSWQNSWNVTYTRKRAGSKIYIVSDLCLAQAMGSTNSVSYRGILGRAKVNDGVTDRYSDTVEDWQRIDNSFHEYQRQSRIHFGPDNLPGGNTITITMQVSHGGGSGSRSNWGINVWGGRSYIEVFESMEL